jgi:hypothetical protein
MTLSRIAVALGLCLVGCSKPVPPEVEEAVDRSLPLAIKVAEDAAKLCPSQLENMPFHNPPKNSPPPASPAAGTALESDPQVVDVFVMCSFPDPRDASVMGGTGLQSLRKTSQVPARPVTMPEDLAENTCRKDASHCQQVIVPSRVSPNEKSADIRIIRPFEGGGQVEVRVVLVPK